MAWALKALKLNEPEPLKVLFAAVRHEAAEAEREACARLVEREDFSGRLLATNALGAELDLLRAAAAAIRARGKQ